MNIRDYPFKPKCPPDAIELAKKWLVDNKTQFTNMANFVKVSLKQALVEGSLGKPCHAEMMYIQSYKPADGNSFDCIATEIGIDRQVKKWPKKCTRDLYVPYVTWLVRESHFSRFVLNRDDLDFCLTHGIVISGDLPSAVVQNTLISARYVVECHPDAFHLFNEMIAAGYPGSAAYSIAFHSTLSSWAYSDRRTPETLGDIQVYGHQGHRAQPYWSSMTSFKRFMEGDFGSSLIEDRKAHYRNKPTIYGGMQLCDDPKTGKTFVADLLRDKSLAERLASRRGQKYEYTVPRPFKKAKMSMFGARVSSPDIVTRSELTEVVLPYMKETGVFSNAVC